jgi:hypothetical protein
MNAIKETWQQLLRRRLWPVALLLIAALVAVPMVLAKSPAPAPPAPVQHAKKDDISSTYVALADTAEATKRRRVLGAQKDPFEPKALPKVKKAKATATPTPTPVTQTDTGTGTGTTSGGGGSTAPPGVVPTATPAPTETVPAYSIKVRFGTTEADDLAETRVERMSVLPDEENPVLVYRGVEDGGKVAIFELTGDVEAQGDGTCAPTPEDCQYLKLRAGETEFITVTDTGTEADAQYQLDLVKIYKKATKVKATDDATGAQTLAKAASSSLKTKDGVKLQRRNRYVFDAKTGTLHRAAKGAKTPSSSL